MPNAPKRPFHTAADADIKSGEVSDVYFARTVQEDESVMVILIEPPAVTQVPGREGIARRAGCSVSRLVYSHQLGQHGQRQRPIGRRLRLWYQLRSIAPDEACVD